MTQLIISPDTVQPTPTIRDQYFAAELELFIPLKLTPAQERAIEAERTQRHNPLFVAEAPIPVAVLKPSALLDQQLWVPQLKSPTHNLNGKDTVPLVKYFQNFHADGKAMVERLFGKPPLPDADFGVRAGIYEKAWIPKLHSDSFEYLLLMRSLALPYEFVRKEDEPRHPDLIAAARFFNAKGAAAQQQLRDLGVLQTAALNTLYLMPSGIKNGILHCSGPMPEDPVRQTPSILSNGSFNYHRFIP